MALSTNTVTPRIISIFILQYIYDNVSETRFLTHIRYILVYVCVKKSEYS